MNKLNIALMLLMLFLPPAFAETEIFSGNIITDTNKNIENAGIFRLKYDEYANKVFVQTPTTNLIVDNGACKSNAVFKVCINRANFTDRNLTTYVSYYEVNLDIYKLTGSLETEITSTLATLLPNEATELAIKITNPTDFEITGIKYTQNLSNFFLQEVTGCTINGEGIEWTGSLKSKYEKKCTLKMSTDIDGNYNLAGSLTYFNGFEKETIPTKTVAIKVLPRQLKVQKSVDSYVEINRPFHINFSVQNANQESKIEGTMNYEIPASLKIIETTGNLIQSANTLRRSLNFGVGAILNFSLYLEPISEGNYAIKEEYSYIIKNVQDNFENATQINVIEPKPIINLTSEYAELKPGQKFIVIVTLANPSKFYDFKNIKAQLDVPFNNKAAQTLGNLKPNESYVIISNVFTVPENIDTPRINSIGLSALVEYELNGMRKSAEESLTLSFNKSSDNLPQTAQSETSEIAVQQPQQPVQDQSSEEREQQPPQTIEATMPSTKFKVDFSDKRLWVVFGLIIIVIFVVPVVIYSIRKKRNLQAQQQPEQQKQNPQQPKDF